MARFVLVYIDDIVESIDNISTAIVDKRFEDYVGDWVLRRATERGVEIISEASRRIPEELRNTQTQIPWPLILGIGNVLRHEYRRVSNEAMYNIARNELADLKIAVLAIAATLDEPEE
jgi:uncharacterized protein with HEPN domain